MQMPASQPPKFGSALRVGAADGSLIPNQQPTPLKLTKSADYYEQHCVKYPHRACFHSYSEFIHALLLEADSDVTAFVPQPYCLRIGRKLYTPDVYIVRKGRITVSGLEGADICPMCPAANYLLDKRHHRSRTLTSAQ